MDKIKDVKKEISVISLIALGVLVGWVVYDNYLYFALFPGARQASAANIGLSVTVSETFTFSIVSGSQIPFGSIANGTKYNTHETVMSVLTNSADGWSVTAGRDRTNSTFVSDGAPSTYINDTGTAGPEPATNVPSCTAAVWPAVGTSRGLGFSVFSASAATSIKDSCWGTGGHTNDTLNKYAALAASVSATKIARNAAVDTSTQYISVGYLLEILSSQGATSYKGEVIYSGTQAP
mgnify:FL=1